VEEAVERDENGAVDRELPPGRVAVEADDVQGRSDRDCRRVKALVAAGGERRREDERAGEDQLSE
jgi:hypothetical protein